MDPLSFIDSLTLLEFAGLWLAVLVGGNILGRWYVRRIDHTDQLSSLPLSPRPDVLDLAYLRGAGEAKAEVARLAVLALLEAGYLEVQSEKMWWLTIRKLLKAGLPLGTPPPIAPLDTVYGWFDKPRATGEVHDNVLGGLKSWYKGCEERLRALQLRAPSKMVWAGTATQILLMATLLGLAVLKTRDLLVDILAAPMVAPMDNNRSWGPIVITGVIVVWTLVLLWALTRPCRAPWLSKRGQAYLLSLQGTAASLRQQVPAQLSTFGLARSNPETSSAGDQHDSSLLLGVALFGSDRILSKTPYGFITGMFKPDQSGD